MGFVEGIHITLTAFVLGTIVYLAIEARRGRRATEALREAMRESDASHQEHRKAMIAYAADVLRETLSVANERGVARTGRANDNDDDAGAEVIPFPRDAPEDPEPDPSK